MCALTFAAAHRWHGSNPEQPSCTAASSSSIDDGLGFVCIKSVLAAGEEIEQHKAASGAKPIAFPIPTRYFSPYRVPPNADLPAACMKLVCPSCHRCELS